VVLLEIMIEEDSKTEGEGVIDSRVEKKVEDRIISDTGGKIGVGDDVIQIRKDKIVELLKGDTYLSAFVIIAIVSLVLAVKDLGVGAFVSDLFNLNFIKSIQPASLMFVLSIVSGLLVYYKKKKFAFAPMVLWVGLLAVKIRTRNLDRLRDVTTGTWTLGPDLDPFLFYRWAKYIVENGTLFVIDTMRYPPLGYNTSGELLLHPYMMAWFHKYIAGFFGTESVMHSSVLYPVFMFFLTVIAFFLLVRKIFVEKMGDKNASIIALVASFLLSVVPVLLPRTIAGIPEKESAAFLFLFLSFYLFLAAWKAKKFRNGMIVGLLAGAATAGMALVWGGYVFVFLSIGPAVFLAFLLGKMDRKKLFIYAAWVVSAFALMYPFSTRYDIKSLLTSYITASSVAVLFIVAFHIFVYMPYLNKYFNSGKFSKVPSKIISSILAVIGILILISILFGPSLITSQIGGIFDALISPSSARIQQTVAENRQPFFTEWVGSFGPHYRNIPILFWLFFIGSIYLFHKMVRGVFRKKERIALTFSYFILISFIIFSRYAGSSTFNGTNTISKLVYALGFITFLGVFGRYYYFYHRDNEEDKLRGIDFGFILIFVFVVLSIVAARSSVRTIMVLAPATAILAAYLAVSSFNDAGKVKNNTGKIVAWILVGIIVIATIFTGWQFYKAVNGQAAGYAPSGYTQQWQKAMSWVRENTLPDSVFGHWWDYGYWLQSIGERATVLDGGNAQGYWNHMMGRYALTGPDSRKALEYLYAHNSTHFLIDSTDIGKYTAFSSIGSDANHDRRSWLTIFQKNSNQAQETKDSTIYLYEGGTSLDGDIIFENNETKIFLPEGRAGIGGILVERDDSGKIVSNPIGVYVDQGQQHRLPLRYAFADGELIDFGSGVEAGVFIFPRANQAGGQLSIERDGAMIYLSSKTVNSQLARLYLYKENDPNFKLVHSEDDFIVSEIRAQNPGMEDLIFFNGLRGPIRIWEIVYPEDIEFNEDYILIFPKEDLGFDL
jgi:asparagine N-glycosylation enzyme membrane subunit Stt3